MAISSVGSNARPGVCTSTTRPTAPFEGQLIYETDTDKVLVWNGSAWYANWNTAWGIVETTSGGTNGKGYKTGLAKQTVNQGTTTDLTDSSMTFTGIAGRMYRYSCMGYLSSSSASAQVITYVTDASNNIKWQGFTNGTNSSGGGTNIWWYVFTATGSTTVKMRLNSLNGNNTIFEPANSGAITLEDIGPS